VNASGSANTIIPRNLAVPVYLAFLAAGLAGNYFNFPVFFNINFLFGSIFAMLALQYFGLGWGILSAAVIAGYTYVLWNHPYAIIIMTAETAVVGLLMHRRKMALVLADTLYWVIIGMPLVYLFYHVVMRVPLSNAAIVMTKQALNGIANAMIARLVFTGLALRSRSRLVALHEIVYNLLAFFVLCPALILLAADSRSDFNETDLRIRTMLRQESLRVTDSVETWLMNRKAAILGLSDMAVSRSPRQLQPYLEQTRKSDKNFLRIGLANRKAVSAASSPPVDEKGKSAIGVRFADRASVPILEQTSKPLFSGAFMSRFGAPGPFVTVLAPVLVHGAYRGYVFGDLSLDQIRDHLDKSTDENDMFYTLLDKNGNVVMTNRADQKSMTPFVRCNGTLTRLNGSGLGQWIPNLPPNTAMVERWQNSFYVAEAAIGDPAGWKLILDLPVAPFQKALNESSSKKLTLLLLIFLAALALVELLSRRIVATLAQLRRITYELPARVETDGKEIDWPESGIKEINHLIINFRETAETLTEQLNKVRQINESLEQRVDERTNQLAKITQDLNFILDNAPVGIAKVVDRKQIWVNRVMVEMFQYSKEEMEHQTTRKLYPSDEAFERLGREAYSVLPRGVLYETVQELIRKDGSHVTVRYVGKAMDPKDMSKGTIWLLEDITERRKAEESLRESEKRIRDIASSLGEGIYVLGPDGGLTFMNPEAEKILGWTEAELLNRNIHDVIHSRRPDGTPLPFEECQMHTVMKTGARFSSDNEFFIRKDGTVFPVTIISTPLLENGKPISSVTAFRDISDAKRAVQEREKLIEALHKALEEIKTLHGILPICSSCKKIRDDKGSWTQMEVYISEHTDAEFSHGLCAECAKKLYPNIYDKQSSAGESRSDPLENK
jgi:two-component system cell cycle sensor histidine kinase/response regulator CckA